MTYQDDFEQHFLIDLHKFLVPVFNVSCLFAAIGVVVGGSGRVVLVVFTPFKNLFENNFADLDVIDVNNRPTITTSHR